MYFMLFHHTHSLVPLSTQCLTEYLLCSLSLPDEFMPFNQAPGSHRVHQRHPSISSSFSDFGDPLSQQEHFDMPSSFSQEAPMQRPREEHEFHRLHFSGSYEPEIMRGRSQYHQYGSDPYPNPPNFPPERQSRSLNRGNGRIMHEDYSPGPMHQHHPPPPSPGGPFGMDMDPLHLHICTVLLLQEVTYLLFILCQVFILSLRMAHFLLAFPPCLLLDPQIQFHLLLPLHLTHQGWEWVHHQCICLHLIMVIYLPGVLPLLDHVD